MRTVIKGLLLCLAGVIAMPVQALNIFACEPEWAALARQLAPDATVFSATHAYQDPHYIEARPSLIARLRRADIAFCSGAELEAGWLPALQQRAADPAVRDGLPGMVYAADIVSTIEKHQVSLVGRGHVHAQGNPHLHLDPERVEDIAKAFSQRLQRIDSDNADLYQQALATWHAHWKKKKLQWRQQSLILRDQQIVVQHTTFSYLWRWLRMKPVADLEPSPGVPPTLSHLDGLVTALKDKQPRAIVYNWYQSEKSPRWLAEKTGLPLLSLPSTVSKKDGIETLEQLFDHLIAQLRTTVQ